MDFLYLNRSANLDRSRDSWARYKNSINQEKSEKYEEIAKYGTSIFTIDYKTVRIKLKNIASDHFPTDRQITDYQNIVLQRHFADLHLKLQEQEMNIWTGCNSNPVPREICEQYVGLAKEEVLRTVPQFRYETFHRKKYITKTSPAFLGGVAFFSFLLAFGINLVNIEKLASMAQHYFSQKA